MVFKCFLCGSGTWDPLIVFFNIYKSGRIQRNTQSKNEEEIETKLIVSLRTGSIVSPFRDLIKKLFYKRACIVRLYHKIELHYLPAMPPGPVNKLLTSRRGAR